METLDLSRRGVLLNDEQLGPYPLEKLKRVERLTVDIVEDSPRVDEKEMAFAKCRLGGFGDVLKKRMEDFTVRVPIGASYYHFQKYLNDYPENEVAPEKAPLPEDTRIVTRHIKKMAYFTGAEMVFVAGPLVYMFVLSFQTRAEVWGVVNQFTLDNYKNIFQPVYLNTFVESFKLALTSTLLICAIGYPFGYFMAKLPAQWKKRVMLLLMIPFWTSSLIRLYGWIIIFRANGTLDKLLMGLGLTDSPLKLLYTYPAVVVGMVYALLQFMILAVYSSAEKMDWSLVEAARDLGATPLKAFLTVTLKLTLPGLLSGVILTFIPSMGLFFIADILGGNKVVLVGSLIQDQLMKAHNWPFAAALSVVLMILTSLMISLYKRVTHTTELEGIL